MGWLHYASFASFSLYKRVLRLHLRAPWGDEKGDEMGDVIAAQKSPITAFGNKFGFALLVAFNILSKFQIVTNSIFSSQTHLKKVSLPGFKSNEFIYVAFHSPENLLQFMHTLPDMNS